MAPESLRGEMPTPRTDLYSLGVVGCYLLSGSLPFEGNTAAEFMIAHLQQEPIRPSSRCSSVPADLEAVVLRALAKDPARRPASALEMRAMLLACADAGGWSPSDAAAWWGVHGAMFRTNGAPSV